MTSIPGTDPGPIGKVHEKMTVVDDAGERVGTVKDIKMGDPEAATEEGQHVGAPSNWADRIAEAFGAADPAVPAPEAARLLRTGYVRIDTAGLFAGDTYASADQIAHVEGDLVELNVSKEALHGATR
jgi:hypothetical protein